MIMGLVPVQHKRKQQQVYRMMSWLSRVTLNPLFNNAENNLRFLKGWYSTFYAFNISLPNGPSKEDAFFIMDNLLDLIENSKAVVECMYIVYS